MKWPVKWSVKSVDRAAVLAFVAVLALGLVVLARPSYVQFSAASSSARATDAPASAGSSEPASPTASPSPSGSADTEVEAPGSSPTSADGETSTGGGTETGDEDPGPLPITAAEARALTQSVESLEDLLGPSSLPSGTPDEPVEPTTFRVGSFNVLGHSHTVAGGDRPQFAEGPMRMRWAMQIIQGADLDVVGLQEFQAPQLSVLQGGFGGAWDVFPGLSRERKSVQNSIIWRSDVWQLEESSLVVVPYFRGNPFPMPFIKLRHVETGQSVWFINIHNPANVHGNAEGLRDRGMAIEAALVKRLHADGTPVVLTGDFNEKGEAFCAMAGRAGMLSADGGSFDGGCRPPANPGIDWIFHTSDIASSGYVRTRAGLIQRTSDHPFVHTTATVGE